MASKAAYTTSEEECKGDSSNPIWITSLSRIKERQTEEEKDSVDAERQRNTFKRGKLIEVTDSFFSSIFQKSCILELNDF